MELELEDRTESHCLIVGRVMNALEKGPPKVVMTFKESGNLSATLGR